jgi:prepilin-type N-terminal cleavage/methylation domain-containing protein
MKYSFIKKTSAFTLIEVIVTATIIAVLAISAAVMYRGYINETRKSTVSNLAEAAAASANAYTRKTGVNLTSTDSAQLHLFFPDPTRFTVTINPGSGIHGRIIITERQSSISDTAEY